MIVMKGKYNIAKIMIDSIDDATKDQIQTFLNQPMFKNSKIAIMPDCHAGIGSCVGFTMEMNDYIMPQIIGVDIGCGVLAVNIGDVDIDVKALDDFIKDKIPHGHAINKDIIDGLVADVCDLGEGIARVCYSIDAEYEKVLKAIPSLGGGNHFIELDRDEENNVWVVVHTGSRNFGKRIADYYQREAKKELERYFITPEKDMEFVPMHTQLASDYIFSMNVAQEYAQKNRVELVRRIVGFLNISGLMDSVQSVHNYINFNDGIIRKGAISANEGEKCIIPFNSAEGSIIGIGKGNKEWNCSAPHGAGRIMSRKVANATLDYREYQKRLADNGVYSTTANSSTLDEAPMAYKSKDIILQAVEPTVSVEHWLKPFYNFKAPEKINRK